MNALNSSHFRVVSSVFARTLLGALLLFPAASFGAAEDALISISRNAGDIEIRFVGVLQSANTLAGPWVDESGGSPKKVIPSVVAGRYYRIKPFELPVAARFAVDLETGEVGIAPGWRPPQQGLHAAAVFAGSTIGFDSSVVLDEGGNPGRKVLSVSLVNQSGESVGEDPNGVLGGIKVIFGEIKNLSTPSDLRLQAMVSTLAGSGAAGSIDGPALSATFINPVGVATGPDGSIYVCDGPGNRIRKFRQNQVFTVAGSGAGSSVDGVGTAASFNFPRAIAYSAAANGFIIVEQNGRRVRLLTLNGTVTTVAGTGAAGGNNGTGNVATFNDPTAVAVDGAGAIYVGEYPGERIRKITLTGGNPGIASSYTVATWAGSGVAGPSDGIGTAAQFNRIYGLTAEQDGTLYVADAGNFKVRRVSPAREVVTIAGGPTSGSVDGNGVAARFKGPAGIVLLNGSLAVSENNGHSVRMLTLTRGGTVVNPADWQVRTLAGTGTAGGTDGRGDLAQFSSPFSVTVDGGGNLIVADYSNRKLRRVAPTAGYFPVGVPAPTSVTELVQLSNADGDYSFTTAAGAAFRPSITYNESLLPGATSTPRKWAFQVPDGVRGFEFNVTVTAPTDTQVPMAAISNPGPTGVGSPNVLASTLAGNQLPGYVNGRATAARFNGASGISLDQDGNIYVAEGGNNHTIRRISKDRMVTTVAGSPGGGFIDSRGDLAKFINPSGIAVAPDGRTIYVADYGNNAIRRVVLNGWDPSSSSSWFVSTIAGTSGPQDYVDNTAGTAARFAGPWDIAWAPGDVLYVTESSGNRVRRLQPVGADLSLSGSWHVSLVAGSTTAPTGAAGTTDANGSIARFNGPNYIAVDRAGFLYVSEIGSYRIRKIHPNGDVTTLAGSTFGYADGTGASAQFSQPAGVAVDSSGYVFVADSSHRIRRVSPAGVVTTVAGTGSSFPGDFDGSGDTATFYYPQGLAIDAAGTLYIASGGTYLFSGGGGVTSPGLRIRMIQRILR